MSKKRLLVLMVEDEFDHAELICRAFDQQADRFEITVVGTLADAHRILARMTPDLVLADLVLPDGRGSELLSGHELPPAFPTVVMTSRGDEQAAVDAMKAGALDYVVKSPSILSDMPRIVAQAIRAHGHLVQRRRAEKALAEERERLAVTLRSIGDGVITTDADGRITMMNQVAENLTGWTSDEACGRPLAEVFAIINEFTREPCDNPVDKVLGSGGIVGLANHTVLIAKDGTERSIADSGAPIRDQDQRTLGVVLVFRDVTENRRWEAELQRAQKLESLSVLAGGIAHDFNNALTAIIGNVSLAKLYAHSETRVRAKLDEIERAALRTKDLTQQLLTFAKGGAPIKQVVSLSELIRDTAEFGLRGSNVQCDFEIHDDLWPVEVDLGQIGQVISNIVLNADQSMPEGGRIHIGAENVLVEASSSSPIRAGKYVKTTIRDGGIGIAPEHLSKIFDPYFTTKQKGSGLGLAVAYSIVEKHDGYLIAESELNRGTAFSMYLPAHSSRKLKRPTQEPALTKGKARVLLMDDEPDIREVGSEMLQALGYDTESAADGDEALLRYHRAQQSGRPFDAVILDLTIPGGLGGKETVGKILESNPRAKVIVSSGYSNEHVMAQFRDYGFQSALSKPYRIHELSEALRTLLDEDTTENDGLRRT